MNQEMPTTKRKPILLAASLFLLACIPLLVRIFTLEETSIIDPTEARYATIAQHMVSSGDWVTPYIPTMGAPEAYLGKPPMHFWLTAISFQLFGDDEWVARFPSFLCALLSIAVVGICAWRLKEAEGAALTIAFLSSSGVFFFFSGASIVDITLTGFITLATAAYMLRIFGKNPRWHIYFEFALFAAMAGGFMTKGPIAIALSGLPALLFALWQRKFEYLKPFFSWKAIVFFIALVAPWFILSEIRNPGFLKYFLINENFGRYFLKDYGDRYGVGHRHVMGSIWWMFALATLPWGVLLIPIVKQKLYQNVVPFRTLEYRFALCWALATPIFFTFVKQLHMGYIVPALPPSALLLACLCVDRQAKLMPWVKHLLLGFIYALPVVTLSSLFWGGSLRQVLFAFILAAVAYILWREFFKRASQSILLACASFGVACGSAVFAVTPIIEANNSAHSILQVINEQSAPGELQVGVLRARNYSPWYYANASEKKFGRKFTIVGMNSKSLDPAVANLLLKQGEQYLLPADFDANYTLKSKKGSWLWFTKNPVSAVSVAVSVEVPVPPDTRSGTQSGPQSNTPLVPQSVTEPIKAPVTAPDTAPVTAPDSQPHAEAAPQVASPVTSPTVDQSAAAVAEVPPGPVLMDPTLAPQPTIGAQPSKDTADTAL